MLVLRVDELGVDVGADHQAVAAAGLQELLGDGQRVEEAAAGGVDVEGGRGDLAAEPAGDAGGGGRAEAVGRDRGDDDQRDLVRAQSGVLERLLGGLVGEVRGGLLGRGAVPGVDAGLAQDPLFGHPRAPADLLVGDDAGRQVGAGAEDADAGCGEGFG